MAEAIGLTASLVTLSKVIARSGRTIQQIRHAPAEISVLLQELGQISTELEILIELQRAFNNDEILASSAISAQRRSIDTAVQRIERVQHMLQQTLDDCNGTRGRIRWALMGKEKVSALSQDLFHTRTALTSAMSMSICLLQGSFHSTTLHAIEKLTHRVDDSLISTAQVTQSGSLNVFPALSEPLSTEAKAAYTYTQSAQFGTEIPLLGHLAGSLVTLAHQYKGTIYGLSLFAQLPFSRALVADICFKTYSNSWLAFRIIKDSSLAVIKLIPQDSAFLQACEAGDSKRMEYILQRRQATPREVTLTNVTPMLKAIESGKVEAVQMLLDYGADANGLFGRLQTSPLVVAIRQRNVEMVRLLLNHGACCQHVTALGWTPLFYLWSLSEQGRADECSATILTILTGRSDFRLSYLGIIDTVGYAAVHMAAIRGTVTEMQILIDNKVDLFYKSGPADWTAIHHAIEAGRLDMFNFLWPYYEHLGIDWTDAQMWTFLHTAAILGHTLLIQRLIQLGASLEAMTSDSITVLPYDVEDMYERLNGTCWTPAQLAAAYSPKRYEEFMQAVESVLGEDQVDFGIGRVNEDDFGSDDEIWCEARDQQ